MSRRDAPIPAAPAPITATSTSDRHAAIPSSPHRRNYGQPTRAGPNCAIRSSLPGRQRNPLKAPLPPRKRGWKQRILLKALSRNRRAVRGKRTRLYVPICVPPPRPRGRAWPGHPRLPVGPKERSARRGWPGQARPRGSRVVSKAMASIHCVQTKISPDSPAHCGERGAKPERAWWVRVVGGARGDQRAAPAAAAALWRSR